MKSSINDMLHNLLVLSWYQACVDKILIGLMRASGNDVTVSLFPMCPEINLPCQSLK